MLTQDVNKGFGKSQTPVSNTGSKPQSPHGSGIGEHLDYLVVCGRASVQELESSLWACFGVNFDWGGAKPGFRGHSYDVVAKSPLGIEVAFSYLSESKDCANVRVSIPGQPLQHVRTDKIQRLGQYFRDCGFHCTRLDWAIDDFDRLLCMDKIVSACESGNYKGANSHRYFQRQKRGDYRIGRTIYIGSSGSDKQVRIYDKEVESNGQTKSIRYEVQWRDELANSAFHQLFASDDYGRLAGKISGAAIGCISFVNRDKVDVTRCRPLPFWVEFCGRVGEIATLSKRVVQPMITQKIAWIESQVAATIAVIAKCKGWDETFHWLDKVVAERSANLSTAAIAFVQTWFDRRTVETLDDGYAVVAFDWDRV